MEDLRTERSFFREFGAPRRADWLIKAISVSLGMTAFFIVYFQVLYHPIFPVTLMPLTAVDRWIGFRPGALSLYVSLWIYIPLAFVLLKPRRELRSCGVAAIVLSVIGLGIFVLWPTAVANVGRDWASHPTFSFLRNIDASGNACPSLHVAFAVFAAIRVGRLLPEMHAHDFIRVGNWLWCLGIVYSTIATGQHVALDAFAGAALGALIALPRFRGESSVG